MASYPLQNLIDRAETVIFGKRREITLALAAFLAKGHLLIEDLPGLGKTTLARALASLSGLSFSRIQCTNDLLPADILGVSVYERQGGAFRFLPGPIFSQVLLVDEINRATPKTQSALLEAMEELQVTSDGETRALPQPFFVIATQNPAHHIGTFPLPESQLDRFAMRLALGYPDVEAERALLTADNSQNRLGTLKAMCSAEDIFRHQQTAQTVFVAPALLDYIQAILAASRQNSHFRHGLSPRAGLSLLAIARAFAYLDGRKAVLPDDIQAILPSVACHRLRLRQNDESARPEDIEAMLRSIPIP